MIYIVVILLMILLIFEYFIEKKNLFNPSIILIAVYLMATIIAASNTANWGDIESTTAFVIISSVGLFSIGGTLAIIIPKFKMLTNKNGMMRDTTVDVASVFDYNISITSITNAVVIIFFVGITILDFVDMVKLGGTANFIKLLVESRNAIYSGESISHSFFVLQGLYLCQAISYVYIFVVLHTKIIKKSRMKISYYIPLFLYIIQILLSTRRNDILYFVFYVISVAYFLHMFAKGWKQKRDFSFIKYVVLAAVVFFLVFTAISNLRSNGADDIISKFFTYVGRPISALDVYIDYYGIENVSKFWGEETQPLYYSIMSALGQSSNKVTITLGAMQFENGGYFNIYTALRRYLHDYGLRGCYIIMFFLGFFYSRLFKNVKRRFSPIAIILYSFVVYPLIEMATEERFFSHFVTARSVYIMIYIIISYKILVRDKNKRSNKILLFKEY